MRLGKTPWGRTIRIWIVVVCTSFLFGPTVGWTTPETPQFRQVGVADGLPSSGITGLALDRDGYLWISTRDGLAARDSSALASLPGYATAETGAEFIRRIVDRVASYVQDVMDGRRVMPIPPYHP